MRKDARHLPGLRVAAERKLIFEIRRMAGCYDGQFFWQVILDWRLPLRGTGQATSTEQTGSRTRPIDVPRMRAFENLFPVVAATRQSAAFHATAPSGVLLRD